MTEDTTLLCPQCQIGHLQAGALTYVRVVNGLVISIPDTPAHTCDVCGFQEFDEAALARLETLVHSTRSEVSAHRHPARSSMVDTNMRHGLKR